MAGGGASVGVAAARLAFWSPRFELLLAAASCCGDGSVGVPPRGRHGNGGVRAMWGSRPSARLSSLRCFLHRRSGAGKVCRRCFLSSDVEPVQGKRWKGGWSGAGRPIFRRLQLDHAAEAFWPMVVHCFKIRRSTAGNSRLKAWWCFFVQAWWWPVFFFAVGVAGGGERRRVVRWISGDAVVLVSLFRVCVVCVLAYVRCIVLLSTL